MLDSLESGSVAFGAAALAALQNKLANGGHNFTILVRALRIGQGVHRQPGPVDQCRQCPALGREGRPD